MPEQPACTRPACGHTWDYHQHFRRGSEWCAHPRCLCPGYQRPRLLDRLRDRVHVLVLRVLG